MTAAQMHMFVLVLIALPNSAGTFIVCQSSMLHVGTSMHYTTYPSYGYSLGTVYTTRTENCP